MNESVLDYLKTQRTCVLAVEMMDGAPHAATVHFAHSDEPFILYFETNKSYKKAEALLGRAESRASLVVGFTEEGKKTLQMDGTVRLIKPEEETEYQTIYLGKFPEKTEKLKNPDFVKFLFIPSWWRFTDFTDGKKIISSEDK